MAVEQDKGYAWVVLVSTLIINYLCIGFCFGIIGVLTYEYEKEFQESLENVSIIGSFLLASLLLSGPVAAFLIGKLGVRIVAVIAACTHLLAFLLSAFAKTWWHVVLTFAVPCGIACCCCHVCTMKILTVYFNKHQNMAYAASALGSDAAAITLPFITTEIVKVLSYRDSVFVLSAMLAVNIPFAILLKGSPGVESQKAEGSSDSQVDEEDIILREINGNNGSSEEDKPLELVEKNVNGDTIDEDSGNGDTLNGDISKDSNGNALDPASVELLKADNDATQPVAETEHYTLWDHVKLLRNPTIVVFLINNLLWNIGGAVVSVLTYSFCVDKGFTTETASLVMVLFGVGSFCGSTFVTVFSYLSNRYGIPLNRYYLHCICNLTMAIASVIIPSVSLNSISITILMFIIGAGYGTICSNMGAMIEHLNGSHMLYLVYSYELAAAGVGSLLGPVVGAQLNGMIGNQFVNSGYAFYFAGACKFGACTLLVIYAAINGSVIVPFSKCANKDLDNNSVLNIQKGEKNGEKETAS